jgi:hypothetical protein
LLAILTAFTLERVVCFTKRILFEQEQLPQRIDGEVTFGIFFLVYNRRRERLLWGLTLEDFFFDRPSGNETIYEAWDDGHKLEIIIARHDRLTFFLLSVTPDPSECLLISGRIPVCYSSTLNMSWDVTNNAHTRIEQNETIRANEIDPASTSLATKQEYKLFTLGVVELVYQFLPFADGHAPIKPEAAVPVPKSARMLSDWQLEFYFLLRQSFSKRSSVCV